MDWQTIETAPRNEGRILALLMERHHVIVAWDNYLGKEGWFVDWSDNWVEPTHWMPLPEPPTDAH